MLAKGDAKEARKILQKALAEEVTSPEELNPTLAMIDVCEKRFPQALDISSKSADTENPRQAAGSALRIAKIYGHMKKQPQAREYYDKARRILEPEIARDPNSAEVNSLLGIAYAGLGEKEKAIAQGERGVELLPPEKDAMLGIFRVEDLALIYVMVGKPNEAIDKLQYLLNRPGKLSKPWLKICPDWEPLWNLPRFQQLVGEE